MGKKKLGKLIPVSKVEAFFERKHIIESYYWEFAKVHRAFMTEVKERCTSYAWGDLLGFVLCDRFGPKRDKEVALIMTTLIRGDEPHKIIAQFEEIASVMGDKPFVWVASGWYGGLAEPSVRVERLPYSTVTKGHIYRMAKLLHELIKDAGSIQEGFHAQGYGDGIVEVMTDMIAEAEPDIAKEWLHYRVQQLLLVLTTEGRLGMGLWKEETCDIYPECRDSVRFVKTFTTSSKSFYFHELIRMMGLGSPTECYYCYLSYCWLKAEKREACKRYEERFKAVLKQRPSVHDMTYYNLWKELPDIQDFGLSPKK